MGIVQPERTQILGANRRVVEDRHVGDILGSGRAEAPKRAVDEVEIGKAVRRQRQRPDVPFGLSDGPSVNWG